MQKKYQSGEVYERKLKNVMRRMDVTDFDYDYGRRTCYVQFMYKGRAYRFELSVDQARENGQGISYGSDAFAIVVLDLESIARMIEHGTFDLESGEVRGLRQLPASKPILEWFRVLGFDIVPGNVDEVKARYRQLAKAAHPDTGGNEDWFRALTTAYNEAMQEMEDDT